MHLSCRQCGGGVDTTPADLRAGRVTCRHCDTIQRVGPEASVGTLDDPPVGARSTPLDDGLRLSLPRPPGQISINTREVVWGAGVGFALWVAMGCSGLDLCGGMVIAGIVGVVAAFVAGAGARLLPPVTLRGDQLSTSSLFTGRLDTHRIQQLYVSRTGVKVAGAVHHEAINLWALMDDGRRQHVVGPVPDPELALWAEDVLEVAMGMAQVPVAGQHDAPEPAPSTPTASPSSGLSTPPSRSPVAPVEDAPSVPPPAPPTPAPPGAPAATGPSQPAPAMPSEAPHALDCLGCGAVVPVSPGDARRGWAVCGRCDGLSLVWGTTDRPLLGLGDAQKPRRVTVEEQPDGTVHLVPQVDRLDRVVSLATRGLLVASLSGTWFAGWFIALVFLAIFAPWWVTALAVPVPILLTLWAGLALAIDQPRLELSPGRITRRLAPIPVPVGRWTVTAEDGRDEGEAPRVAVVPDTRPSLGRFLRDTTHEMARSGTADMAALVAGQGGVERLQVVVHATQDRVVAKGLESPAEAFELAARLRATLAAPRPEGG